MRVSFHDHTRSIAPYRGMIVEAVRRVAVSGNFILKSTVEKLEEEFASWIGASQAIAVSNESDAMVIALQTIGVGPGSEVLFSALAPAHHVFAAMQLGATPVFFDDSGTEAPSAKAFLQMLSDRSQALVVGRFFHCNSQLHELRAAAAKRNIRIVEEISGAQSEGERFVHRESDLVVVSLGPQSELDGLGDAALIVANDANYCSRARMLRNHGQDGRTRFLHHEVGYNHRMDEVNAAYLLERLHDISQIQSNARLAYERYRMGFFSFESRCRLVLGEEGETLPKYLLIRTEERDVLRAFLEASGVETEIPSPLPLPLQPALKPLGYSDSSFPLAITFCRQTLALPFYAELTPGEIEYVTQCIERFYAEQ